MTKYNIGDMLHNAVSDYYFLVVDIYNENDSKYNERYVLFDFDEGAYAKPPTYIIDESTYMQRIA